MPSSKNELLLIGRQVAVNKDRLVEGLSSDAWHMETWLLGESEARLKDLFGEAEVAICGYDAVDAGIVQKALPFAEGLRLLQIPFRGFDWLTLDALPDGCTVCNSAGHQIAIAEYVMAAMLAWEKDLSGIDRSFRGGTWAAGGFGSSFSPQGELFGKTLGLIGYGLIGQEIAKRAKAFGMRTIAVSRSNRELPTELDGYNTMDGLVELLQQSDHVVVTCTLNEETQGLLNGDRLGQCRPQAVITNIARGPVIEEVALFEALSSRQIAGAILDVWYCYPDMSREKREDEVEPRPSNLPFHELDNVIMTPHCSARTKQVQDRVWQLVVENLNRFSSEQPLLNVVRDAKPALDH